MANKKTTKQYASEVLEKYGLSIIGEYTGASNPVTVYCSKGHENTVRAEYLLRRSFSCTTCGDKPEVLDTYYTNKVSATRRKSTEQFASEIYSKYSVRITGEYLGSKNSVSVLCPLGHINTLKADSLVHRGFTCTTCKTKVKPYTLDNATIDNAEDFAETIYNRYGLRVINEYSDPSTKIQVLCQSGHMNTISADSLLRSGLSCRECKTGKSNLLSIDWTVDNINRLKSLVEEGLDTLEITKIFNTTKASIDTACSKNGIVRPNNRYTLQALNDSLKGQGRSLVEELDDTTYLAKVLTRCSKNHETLQYVNNILQGHGCKQCFYELGKSRAEQALGDYIASIYKDELQYNDRTIVNPQELDIVLPQLKLAFEFNGTYWHSDVKVGKHYHSNKTTKALWQGYQLIHIHEYQWSTKQDIVKSRIASLLGHNTRVGARKCVIKTVDWNTAKIFLEQTHLQGAGSPTSINLALYYKDEIIALMTFGKPRYTKDCEYELIRYSQKLYHNVVGGASKLLNYFENEYLPDDIVSYANRDYSKGTLYENLGFKLSHISEPNYNYFKKEEKLSRYQTQKAKLEALFPEHWDPKLTESEIMQNAGYLKVYDSGNLVYKKTY